MQQKPDFSTEPPSRSDIKSLIFGIASLLSCQLPLIPVVAGIIAVVYASRAKTEIQSSRSITMGGWITGILGIGLGMISTIYWLLLLLSMLLLLHQERNLTPRHPNPDFYSAPGQPAVLLRMLLHGTIIQGVLTLK